MAKEDHGKSVRIDFGLGPDFPTKYASNLVVQHTEHDFTITFFDIRPPLLVGGPEDKTAQLDALNVVNATPVARIVVAATRMPEFVQVLQDNLKSYQRRADKTTAEDRD